MSINSQFENKIFPKFFTNKQRILIFLWSNQNVNVYSEDIQDLLGIHKSYASTLLTELEHEGLIIRERNGRKKVICLTENGFKMVDDISHIFEREN